MKLQICLSEKKMRDPLVPLMAWLIFIFYRVFILK